MCLPVFLRTPIAVAGAKVAPLSSYTSFFAEFFSSFFRLFLNSLITDSLHIRFFQYSVRIFWSMLCFWQFLRFSGWRFWRVFSFWGRFLKRNQDLRLLLNAFLISQSRKGAKFSLLELYFAPKPSLLHIIFSENCSPSPDRSGNPFVPGFGTKDCSG